MNKFVDSCRCVYILSNKSGEYFWVLHDDLGKIGVGITYDLGEMQVDNIILAGHSTYRADKKFGTHDT